MLGNDCTIDTCNDEEGCLFEVSDDACNDGIECTDDSCDVEEGCVHLPDDRDCDGDLDETCDPDEGCAYVIWVDCEHDESGSGAEDDPYDTIQAGFGDATDAVDLNVIRVAPGDCEEPQFEFNQKNTNVVVFGDPGLTWASTGDRAIKISNNSKVTIRQADMTSKKRVIELTDTAEITLDRVTLRDAPEEGLKATGKAKVYIARSYIHGNGKGGLRIEDVAALVMENTFVVGNGGTAGFGGLWIKDNTSTLTAINSTVADNFTPGVAGGIRAAVHAEMTLANMIFWNNTEFEGTQCQGCEPSDDVLMTDDPLFARGDGLRTDVGHYKIKLASPARNEGVSDGAPEVDYFGSPRSDKAVDIGAHEHQLRDAEPVEPASRLPAGLFARLGRWIRDLFVG